MTAGKALFLGCPLLLAGCQSWQFTDLGELPPTAALPAQSQPGFVEAWYFDGIAGARVSDMLSDSTYPSSPSEIQALTALQRLDSRGNRYGTLIRGFIEAPSTGEFRFFVSGDDETQFWFSDSMDPTNVQQIATAVSATALEEYSRFTSQTSAKLYLENGQRYYFEIRHKEDRWDDHFSVAWEGPGFSRQTVTGAVLHSFAESVDSPTSEPEVSAQEAYEQGYRVGYFDGSQSLSFTPTYPMLDADSDGLYDNWEIVYGLSPSDPSDATLDMDGDLLVAIDEFWTGTSPDNVDSDGDGMPDGYEFAYGYDPLDPSDATNDSDGDGYTNLEEYLNNTDPTDPTDQPVETTESNVTTGFVGQYFSGEDLSNLVFTRRDETINFNWLTGSPDASISGDYFSIRWTGWFSPVHDSGSRDYRLELTTDDGGRLYLDGALLIDQWKNQSPTTYTATVPVSAGEQPIVTIEYYEYRYDATATLRIVDTVTGSTVALTNQIQSPDLTLTTETSSFGDGINDIYKLKVGLPVMQPVADLILNPEGVTVIEAYQSGLDPFTLETVSEPTTVDSTTQTTASSVTINWSAPATRVDGTSLSLSEIAYYLIDYGQDQNVLSQQVQVASSESSYTFDNLQPGVWFAEITVVDINGYSSQPSNTVQFEIQ